MMNSSLVKFSHFILFRIIFMLLALKARNDVTLAFTNETDQHALLSLKNFIKVDPSNALSSWNYSVHFCHWRGITCSRRHQRVTVLDLSSRQLVGSVSPHIGNLSFLREIRLLNNSFHGPIPPEIGRLFRLQSLLLTNNSFHGELPTNLSHCSYLRVLSLPGNNIGGNIPAELGSLSNLLVLGLGRNHFSGKIPPSFGNLSSIRQLKVPSNSLVGNIPSELAQLANLEFLNLASNKLFGMVPLSLYNISSFKIFALMGNQLTGNLPPDLGFTLPNLEEFHVANNKFSGLFPPTIANFSRIVALDISFNSLSGPLPMNLGRLFHLELLDLSANKFGTNRPNELSFLVTSLVNCTNLQNLGLWANAIRGDLPNSVVNLSTTLTWLSLSRNYISGSIPQEIGNLVNLLQLDVTNNMLTGSIPRSIGKLSKLQRLYLYANNISGEIPASIGNMSRLTFLQLENNTLDGRIPPVLGNITNLQELFLGNNRLTGLIPSQIVGLSSSIWVIHLDKNQLTGALPMEIGSLLHLDELVVSENKLNGEIPSTLGNCIMLSSLLMRGNRFKGTIPSSFKQLKSIERLDLSYNNLSGHIPRFLGELPFLRLLGLSYNLFEGQLPIEGVFRNISAFSIEGNSQLCGGLQSLQLPPCPFKAPKKARKHFPQRMIPLVVILPVVMSLVCLAGILFRLRRPKKRHSSTSLLEDQFPKISYGELLQATNGFSITNLIGEGKYASVYRAALNSSQKIVAVKVLNVELHGAYKSFFAECETYRHIRHRNLIKIISTCSSIDFKGCDFKALILEFMPKGNLDSWLHPSPSEQNEKNLSLLQRLNIAIDVASAVDYLHHHLDTRIIHCDLKPSNILLDDDFVARVGDFGLAKFLSASTSEINHPQTSSSAIRGTPGYIPPEYGTSKEVTPQGDVYSYGILLLEMFVRKRPTDNMFTGDVSLYNFVNMALSHKVMEIVDPQIVLENEAGSFSKHNINKLEACLASILQVGLLSSAEMPQERPNIKDVLTELRRTRNLFIGAG